MDGDQLAAQLGITLPLVPVLTARVYRTSYRSREGAEIFEHPALSASRPSRPTGTGSDRQRLSHSVLVVHVADGVDPGEVALADVGSHGVGRMRLQCGHPGPQRSPEQEAEIAALEAIACPDLTRLAFPDGTPIWVVRGLEEQTSMGWRCTVREVTFGVTVVLPLPLLPAVQALATTPKDSVVTTLRSPQQVHRSCWRDGARSLPPPTSRSDGCKIARRDRSSRSRTRCRRLTARR